MVCVVVGILVIVFGCVIVEVVDEVVISVGVVCVVGVVNGIIDAVNGIDVGVIVSVIVEVVDEVVISVGVVCVVVGILVIFGVIIVEEIVDVFVVEISLLCFMECLKAASFDVKIV